MQRDKGKFGKGNPGRPPGTKNVRTVLWDELGKEVMDRNAARFNELMERLWDSGDAADHLRAADLFLKSAEFFKPKLQRISTPDIAAAEKNTVVIRHVILNSREDLDKHTASRS